MRAESLTGSRSHGALLDVSSDQHHPKPVMVTFSNTTQSLPPGTQWDLDVALPNANFQVGRVQMQGPAMAGSIPAPAWREGASIHVTTNASEAMGHSCRSAGSFKLTYEVTYTKAVGDANLTHKIFDSNTYYSSRYIALKDAWIVGAILRLRFHNYYGGSSTLWVKGSALVW